MQLTRRNPLAARAAMAATIGAQSADAVIDAGPVAGNSVSEVAAMKLATFKECRKVLSRRLNQPLQRALLEYTGLRLHILWRHPLQHLWPDSTPVLCPEALRRRKARGEICAPCQDCLRRYWNPAAPAAGRQRAFTGPCGATNFRANLQAGDTRLLTLVLQTLPASGIARPLAAQTAQPALQDSQPALAPRAVSFSSAVALLKVIIHDLEATVQVSVALGELDAARVRLEQLEAEDARLRKELHERAPGVFEKPAPRWAGSHSHQIVQRMLEYVHAHYHHPLQLGEVADALKMNACYLSCLFSHTVGVTFHHYLDELRLAKAKALLRDPTCRVCEVACAVGYLSAGQFWRVFKIHTGLSPCRWRDGDGLRLRAAP